LTDSVSFKLVNHWFNQLVDKLEEHQQLTIKQLLKDSELSEQQADLLLRMLSADRNPSIPEKIVDLEHDWQQVETQSQISEQPIIGSYRLLELIGSGGMGHVYLAERNDGSYHQQVAIKISQFHLNKNLVKRFENERQILAQLTHPHIAQLLDGGTAANEQPYLVMEYIKGLSISEYCIAHNIGLKGRLNLMLQTCEAVSFAHQNLILHRDLKPANILVNENGQVKLLDFGIAKLLVDDVDPNQQTMTQIMTRNYASPEQIKGEPVSTQSDLFSLAVITYELVSGYHPYTRNSEIERDQHVVSGKVKRISARNADQKDNANAVYPELATIGNDKLKGDLENILLKALSSNVSDRYTSIDSFAEDIKNFLTNRPVKARKQTFIYTFKKLFQRQRVIFLTITSLIICLILVSLFSIQKAMDADIQRNFAEMERQQSNQMVEFLSGIFTKAKPMSAEQELTARDLLIQGIEDIKAEVVDAPAQKYELISVMLDSLESLSYFESVFKYVDDFYPSCETQLSPQNEHCLRLLITAGESAIGIQQDERALQYLQPAEEQARTAPNARALLAEILRIQFNAYVNLNQYDDAVNVTIEALNYYKNVDKNPIEIINISSDLAVLATHQNRFDEAKFHYDSIRPLIEDEEFSDIKIKTRYYANLSFFYIKQKQFDAAISQRTKAVELIKANYNKPSFSLAWEQESLAKTYFFAGDINSGIEVAKAAIETFEALSSEADKHIYVLKLFLAQMLVMIGDVDSADNIFHDIGYKSWDRRCLYELVAVLIDVYGNYSHQLDGSKLAYTNCIKDSSYPTKYSKEFKQLIEAEAYFLKGDNESAKIILKQLEKYWQSNPLEGLPLQPKAKQLSNKLKKS